MGGGGKEGEDATRAVTWSHAPSLFGCDLGHPVKSFDISVTTHTPPHIETDCPVQVGETQQGNLICSAEAKLEVLHAR